ncbi:MAG: RNase adapter RapZ [Steroidobacteraceae bacterium]
MRLILVSGLSGSGKSVALHMLEDLGYYCVDNIPAALLKPFISHTLRSTDNQYQRVAVGLDARNTQAEIATVPALINELKASGIPSEMLFLTASDEALLRRFAETRRKHPLSRTNQGLREAIALERELLDPVVQAADLIIDTSLTGVHELRDLIRTRVERRRHPRLSILFESFGFKYGIPGDADFVFDARALPNPYWEPGLRALTGRDDDVARYLETSADVSRLIDDISRFIEARIPEYLATNRGYLTVAIGCTGGQHRSVYLVEKIAGDFAQRHRDVSARHASLPGAHIVTLGEHADPGA